MQVDPITHTLKAPEIKHLKLKHDGPVTKFAFSFNLRHYIMATVLERSGHKYMAGSYPKP